MSAENESRRAACSSLPDGPVVNEVGVRVDASPDALRAVADQVAEVFGPARRGAEKAALIRNAAFLLGRVSLPDGGAAERPDVELALRLGARFGLCIGKDRHGQAYIGTPGNLSEYALTFDEGSDPSAAALLAMIRAVAATDKDAPFKPDWANYEQGRKDGREEALEAALAAPSAQPPACTGTNCTATDRFSHSRECLDEHDAIVRKAALSERPLFDPNNPRDGYCTDREWRERQLAAEAASPSAQPSGAPEVQPKGPPRSPQYGVIPWDELLALVTEVTGSPWTPDERFYIGHQMTGINYNSLNRIASAYKLATAPTPSGAPADTTKGQK